MTSGKRPPLMVMDNIKPRKVYVFRPNEEMTIEPEYFFHDKKPPVGTIIYDPLDDTTPWTIQTSHGQAILSTKNLDAKYRALQLILGPP
jgi:hypothetical protein